MLNVIPQWKLLSVIYLIYGSNADSWSVPEKEQYLLSCFLKSPFQWSRMFPACGVMWLQAVPLYLGFEVLWVLAKKSIMGIKTLKAEAFSPHIWWWVCFIACMDYTEGLKPRPTQYDHTDLCPYHTCPPHIAAPIAECENNTGKERCCFWRPCFKLKTCFLPP